jgi:phosphotransferase system  glucose/maltose/N-acetylglucosamine-specific IIC component
VPEDQLEQTIEQYNHYIVGAILAIVVVVIAYFAVKHTVKKNKQ